MIGLLGKKLGMTQVYDEYDRQVAVTAIEAGPCTILRLRETARDGYQAVQVGFETVKERRLTKPVVGQFKKAGQGLFRYVQEFRLDDMPAREGTSSSTKGEEEAPQNAKGALEVGQQLTVELFKENELVDVAGTSIGKGFQGGVKRWNWKGGPQTHGSMSHRAPGSIGSSTFPARVFRGHHLPGHMGAERVTLQNVRIIRLDAEANLLLLEGPIPGPERGLVWVQKSVKRFEVVKAVQAVEVVEEEDARRKKAKPAAKKK